MITMETSKPATVIQIWLQDIVTYHSKHDQIEALLPTWINFNHNMDM